jgi:hypothetical protein
MSETKPNRIGPLLAGVAAVVVAVAVYREPVINWAKEHTVESAAVVATATAIGLFAIRTKCAPCGLAVTFVVPKAGPQMVKGLAFEEASWMATRNSTWWIAQNSRLLEESPGFNSSVRSWVPPRSLDVPSLLSPQYPPNIARLRVPTAQPFAESKSELEILKQYNAAAFIERDKQLKSIIGDCSVPTSGFGISASALQDAQCRDALHDVAKACFMSWSSDCKLQQIMIAPGKCRSISPSSFALVAAACSGLKVSDN